MTRYDNVIDDGEDTQVQQTDSPALTVIPIPRRTRNALQNADSAIVLHEDSTMTLRNVRMTGAGLQVTGAMSKDDMEYVTTKLVRFQKLVQVYIGDALNAAEELGHGDITAKAEEWGVERQTLYNWKSAMKHFDISLRKEILEKYQDAEPPGISHYMLIQARDDKQDLLDRIIAENWSIARLREELKKEKPATKTEIQIASEIAVSTVGSFTAKPPKTITKKKRAEIENSINALLLLIDQAQSILGGK